MDLLVTGEKRGKEKQKCTCMDRFSVHLGVGHVVVGLALRFLARADRYPMFVCAGIYTPYIMETHDRERP